MSDEHICHFRRMSGLFFLFSCKILLANNVDPDQTPHHVESDLGPHCLPMTRLRVSRYNGLTPIVISMSFKLEDPKHIILACWCARLLSIIHWSGIQQSQRRERTVKLDYLCIILNSVSSYQSYGPTFC